MSSWLGIPLVLLPMGTFLLAVNHPRSWCWICEQRKLRGRGLCVLIALERMFPLLIFNPYVLFFVYLPELTALNIFDAALPVIHFKQNHYLLALLAFLLNYLMCVFVLERIMGVRQRLRRRN